MLGPSCPQCAKPYEWSQGEIEEEVWGPRTYSCSECHEVFTVDAELVRALQRIARDVTPEEREAIAKTFDGATELLVRGELDAATQVLLSPILEHLRDPSRHVGPRAGEDPGRWWREHLLRLGLDGLPSCFDRLDEPGRETFPFSWMPVQGASEAIDVEITAGPAARSSGRLRYVMKGWAYVEVEGELQSVPVDEITRV